MIKVEKGMREIKAVNGVPDIMTDLACIIRSIRTTMVPPGLSTVSGHAS